MNHKTAATTLLVALLSLGAKTAEANITNQVNFYNNTTSTLTLVSQSNTAADPLGVFPAHTYSSEYWISTDPNGVEQPCAYANPPQTIQPGQSGCFYVEARDAIFNDFNGAGGSMTYSIAPYPVNVNDPPLSVTWTWSTPWSSQGFESLLNPNGWWASAAVTQGSASPQGITGTTEYGYTVGWSDPGGQTVDFSLNGAAITASMQSVVGIPGFIAYIGGTGFTPSTQVYFNNVPALGLSCTTVLCTVTVPEYGSVQNGDVGVTVLGVAGNAVAAGSYYELPSGPKCSYAISEPTPTFIGSAASITPTCSAPRRVAIYEQESTGWAVVGHFDNTLGQVGEQSILAASVGETTTLVGCTLETNGQFPVPGENGCDAPTTVTVPVTIIHPPIKK